MTEVSILGKKQFFFIFTIALGPTQRPMQWVSEAVSPRVKLERREAEHSPASVAKVKNGSYSSSPRYVFIT
jgi:hypothetical protein